MPDPRYPQRPTQGGQPRQPAAQQPAQSQATNKAKLVRQLDPSEQAPPLEQTRKIKKGESYWIVGNRHLDTPRKAKIVRLSNAPGQTIGVEFAEPVGGVENGEAWGINHDCDGHGKMGHCLFVRPDQLLDDKAMETFKAKQGEFKKNERKWEEMDEMTIGPGDPNQGKPPTSPPPASKGGSEKMTIGKEDVDTLDLGEDEEEQFR